jgi:hypothetical protein
MLDSAKAAISHVSHPHEKDRDSHLDHPVHFEKPLDFEDPHRAALEQNPEVAERLSRKTLFAVGVCDPDTLNELLLTALYSLLSWASALLPRVHLLSSPEFWFQSATSWVMLQILVGS